MPNRTVCSVLDEMRNCIKTNNFSYLDGLIEETQMLANRMEAAIWDQHDIKGYRKKIKELKTKRDELIEQVGSLEAKISKS